YLEYSHLLREQGKQEEAAAALKEGLERVPTRSLTQLYQEYSQVLQEQGKQEDAAAALQEGLERVRPERNLFALYQEYSQLLRAQGKQEEAAAALKEGLERVPTRSLVALYQEYGQLLRAQGKQEEAAAAFKEGLERVPPEQNLFVLYVEYSQVLRAQSKQGEAAAALQEGLERISHHNKTYLMCAQASLLIDQNDLPGAINLLDDVIQLASRSSTPYAYRACLHWAQGELELARSRFEQGISFSPGRGAMIYRYYSAFLAQTGQPEQARRILAQEHNLPPDAPEIDRLLSELYAVRPEEIWSVSVSEPLGVTVHVETPPVQIQPVPAPKPGPIVNVLHISDIHRGKEAPISNRVLQGKLMDDIRRTYDEDNARLGPDEPRLGPPDIIVVSGDLTQKAHPDEYKLAREFLEGLLELVDGQRHRVVLVPGNHDVNWALSEKSFVQATEQEYKDQPQYDEPYRQGVKKRLKNGTYWRKVENAYTKRFQPFKEFFDDFYQGAVATHAYPLERERMYSVYDYGQAYGLVIVGFNTCDEIDHLDRRAFINDEAIHRAERDVALRVGDPALLRIAVFHHNIRSVQHGEDFLDPKYLQTLKRHDFDLCLHGHAHTAGVDIFDPTQSRTLPLLGAGSLAVPYRDRPPAVPKGYNLLVINREDGSIFAHTRRYDEGDPVFRADYRWNGKPYVRIRPPRDATE
ncbi:MAG: metallophosphoesterase, partial [Anaerolineae bacterium]